MRWRRNGYKYTYDMSDPKTLERELPYFSSRTRTHMSSATLILNRARDIRLNGAQQASDDTVHAISG